MIDMSRCFVGSQCLFVATAGAGMRAFPASVPALVLAGSEKASGSVAWLSLRP